MKWNGITIYLAILSLAAQKTVAAERKNYNDITSGNCKNRQFRRNRHDSFEYVAITENGIHGTTKNKTSLRTTAQIEILNWQSCDFILKVFNFKVEESVGWNEVYKQLDSSDLSNRLSEYELRFKMQHGVVNDIHPSIKSLKSDVLNIQRAILSLLQIRQGSKTKYTFTDNDVSGLCPTDYKKHTNGHGVVDDNEEHIDKIKHLNQCQYHEISHSNVDGKVFNENEEIMNSPVLKSKSLCTYTLNKRKKAGLKKVICKENFLVQAFSSDGGAGAYVENRVTLTRKSSKRLSQQQIPYKTFYSTSIRYDHDHQHENEREPSYQSKVQELTQILSQQHFYESQSNSAEKFFELVTSFRHISVKDITTLMGNIDLKVESVRSFVFDALAQCGTPSCLSVLFGVLQKHQMIHEIPKMLPALAFIKEPTPEVIRMLMDMHNKYKNPSTLLVMSSMVYKLCNHRPLACNEKGTIGKVIEDVEFYIWRLLGKDCQTKDISRQNDIFYALKAIGNLGRPKRIEPLIIDCIKRAAHVNISVAAVQSLRRMELTDNVIDVFHDVLTNKNEELEKRIEIFLMLMKTPKEETIILARDLVNDEGDSTQLRSFISSYLQSASNYDNPTKKSYQETFMKVLKEYPLNKYDPPVTRYSKAFMKSFNLYKFAGTAEGMSIFHPESFVPRTVHLNLTTHMFGFSLNALEVNTRMEGLEMMLGKVLGKTGYFSKEYVSKVFDIPEMNKARKKRSMGTNDYDWIDEKVNMKQVTPQALTTLKVFGNEIQVFSLDDIPLFNGKMDEMNIFKELYQLTKGKRTTFKRNMILIEVSHSVPTMLGLPLKIAVNSSAVMTLDVSGKLKTSNIMLGLKDVQMEGSLKPSVSVHGSAKLSVECMGVGELGTKFQARLHVSKQLNGQLKYEEGKELEVTLNADQQITDMMNISYDIFHVLKNKNIPLRGVDKVSKGRFCLDDLFNSSIIFGSNTCMDISFPNVYYNTSVPYFPLTGPFKLGMRNYPADPLLTNYHLLIKKNGGTYDITMETPGTLIDRKHTMSVSLSNMPSANILGFTFGELKRGIVLEYDYNNQTSEFEAKLTCNITQSPLMLYGAYFNETDRSTLNRYVGGKVHFSLGDYYFKQTVFYKNMYQYWAFGSDVEYMPTRFAHLDIKIQYEPQRFTLNFTHPSTNTHVIAHTIPALPLLKGELNVTHGASLKIQTLGKLDISNYEAEAVVNVQPHGRHFKVHAKWVTEDKYFYIEGNLNGIPLSFNSRLSYTDESNVIKNDLTVSKHILTNEIQWNGKEAGLYFTIGEHKSSILVMYDLDIDNLQIDVTGEFNGTTSKISYVQKNDTDMHSYCVEGHVTGLLEGFGYCLNVQHSDHQSGIVVKFKQQDEFDMFEAQWIDGFKILSNKQPNQISFHTEILDYFNIEYVNSKNTLSNSLGIKVLSGKLYFSVQELSGKNIFQIDVTQNNEQGETFRYTLYYARSMVKAILFNVYFKAVTNGEVKVWLDVNTKIEENNSQTCFKLLNEEAKDIYSVVLKDSNEDNMFTSDPDLTFILDKNTKKIKSAYMNFKEIDMKLRLVDDSNYGNYVYAFNGVFGEGSLDKFSVVKISSKGVSFSIDMNSPFMVGVENILKDDKAHFRKLLHSVLDNAIDHLFNTTLKVKDVAKVDHMKTLLKEGLQEYLTSLSCNKDVVYERYVEGKIDKSFISSLMLSVINLPLNVEMTNITNNPVHTALIVKVKDQINGGNLLKAIKVILNEVIETSKEDGRFTETLSFLQMRNLNMFEKEYLQFMHTVISKFIDELSNEKSNDKTLSSIVSDMPPKYQKKFLTVFKKAVNTLKAWHYDFKLSLSANMLDLFNQLKRNKVADIFLIDYHVIIFSKMAVRHKLPSSLHKAIKHFANDQNYFNFISRLTKFYLSEYGITNKHSNLINSLMRKTSIQHYINHLVSIVMKNAKLTSDRLSIFKKFQETKEIELIIDDFIEHILQKKYKLSSETISVIRHTLMTFDYKQQKLYKGFYSFISSDFIPNLLRLSTNQLKYGDIARLGFKILNTALPKHSGLVNSYQETLLTNQTILQLLQGVYKTSLKTKNLFVKEKLQSDIQPLEDVVSAVIDLLLMEDPNELIKTAKRYSQIYLEKLSLHLNDALPSKELNNLKERVINLFIDKIKDLSEVELKKSGTDTLLILVDEIFDDVTKEFLNYNENFLYNDVKDVISMYATKIQLGDLSIYDTYEKWGRVLNDRLMFMIRLLNQFIDSDKKSFSDRFVEDGKVKYYDIYQSLWNGQVASEENAQQIQLLFDGLERRALHEVMKFTGNYSIIALAHNVFNYIKSLNYTDINSVIESYQNIDVRKFENVTYEALIEKLRLLLVDIGQIREGEYSIDEIVKQYMPQLIQHNEQLLKIMNQALVNIVKQSNIAKHYVAEGFGTARNYLLRAKSGENKIASFLLEVLIPGVDGLIQRIEYASNETNTSAVATMEDNDLCFTAMYAWQLKAIATDRYSLYQNYLKYYQNSSWCDVANFGKTIKELKKDGEFAEKLLSHVEGIVLKAMGEDLENNKKLLTMIVSLSQGMIEFAKANSDPILQKLVFNMASHLTEGLNQLEFYQRIKKVIRRSVKLEDFDLQSIVKKYVTSQIQLIAPKVSATKINSLGRHYILKGIDLTRDHLQNISMIILTNIDEFKSPLLKYQVVVDPVTYAKNVPLTIAKMLKESVKSHREKIRSYLYESERKMRDYHSKITLELQKNTSFASQYVHQYQVIANKSTNLIFQNVISNVNKYMTSLEEELSSFEVILSNTRINKVLHALTKKSKLVKIKIDKIKKQFVNEAMSNISKLLTNGGLSLNNIQATFNTPLVGGIDEKKFKSVVSIMQNNVSSLVSELIYPQLEIAISIIDQFVCELKTNISRYYEIQDGVHQVSFEDAAIVEGWREYDMFEMKCLNVIKNASHVLIMAFNNMDTRLNYRYLNGLLEGQFERKYFLYYKNFVVELLKGDEKTFDSFGIVKKYTSLRLDYLLEQSAIKYEKAMRSVIVKINQDISIVPPTGMEVPILRFLGLDYKEAKLLFQPQARTAYIFEKSIVTYDGKTIYLPRDLQNDYVKCKYLLTRDFLWNNFTILLHEGSFIIELKDGKIVIDRQHQEIYVYRRSPPTFQLELMKEFPVQLMFTSVTMEGSDTVKIDSLFGVTVYCSLDVFACNVTISGYYHNKTIGLFGTNNDESSDELRMPNGKLSSNLLSFINSYELTRSRDCVATNPEDVFGGVKEDDQREKLRGKCGKDFNKVIPSDINNPNTVLRSTSFVSVCMNEQPSCQLTQQYASSQLNENDELISQPINCGNCSTNPLKFKYITSPVANNKAHLVLVMNLNRNMLKTKEKLKIMFQKINQQYGRKFQFKYSVVAYGGSRVRKQPHLQTGSKNVFMTHNELMIALEGLQFDGRKSKERMGLSALKYAAQLKYSLASKIFLLVDNDASYTNSLQSMMEVFSTLNQRSIILNVINKYKMKRNVIGKDSFGHRYHVRLPKGERIGSIQFPPPDDYMPLVKETGGAVFTLKALTSSRSIWSKSTGIAIGKVISLQINRDQTLCKTCYCNRCENNANRAECDIGY